jgi:hypothetical protein
MGLASQLYIYIYVYIYIYIFIYLFICEIIMLITDHACQLFVRRLNSFIQKNIKNNKISLFLFLFHNPKGKVHYLFFFAQTIFCFNAHYLFNKNKKNNYYSNMPLLFRVMIHYHLNIQLFTILPMWQGGPPLLFEFFYFLKIN